MDKDEVGCELEFKRLKIKLSDSMTEESLRAIYNTPDGDQCAMPDIDLYELHLEIFQKLSGTAIEVNAYGEGYNTHAENF